jgi:hypothetical protein
LEINTTLPFIAIRHDLDGTAYKRTEGEYIVNPLPIEITDVRIDLGGFMSDDAGVIESNPNQHQVQVVYPAQAERYTLFRHLMSTMSS